MLARVTHSLRLRFSSKSILYLSNKPSSSSHLLHHFSFTSHLLHPQPPTPNTSPTLFHHSPFSSNQGGNGEETWRFTAESDDRDSVFDLEEGNLAEAEAEPGGDMQEEGIDVFEAASRDGGKDVVWETAEGYKPWSVGEDDGDGDVFGGGEDLGAMEGFEGSEIDGFEKERSEEQEKLEKREEELLDILHGPNRAFGDLIAASGITEDMIDSLILLRDVRGVKGLPPLSEIEDKAIAKLNATSTRAEVERKKQEEITKARVRKVDEKGRAYGTGRRKCSVARVWVQPGDGKFMVNDKQFDAYFPILDHRADLLRPFTVTNTLGLWDVTCTVKGGGVSGQVGAVRLGISRALQNWEPGLRSYLKAAGFLTRDPRVVERKKPGKAKARKSFQWVKR